MGCDGGVSSAVQSSADGSGGGGEEEMRSVLESNSVITNDQRSLGDGGGGCGDGCDGDFASMTINLLRCCFRVVCTSSSITKHHLCE